MTDRYYQLVLLWVHDPTMFARYVELVRPIVEPYGGRLDRQIVPTSIHGRGVDLPPIVNLVSSPTRERHDAFHRDPQFQAVVHLRSASATLRATEGPSERGADAAGDPSRRTYVIELARFAAGGEAAYRRYEAEAEPVMARFGYCVERVFRPVLAHDLPFVPDLVKVAFFEGDGMDRLHADQAHTRIEAELYPEAVAESLWLVGHASAA